jgi:hypothetical protein
MSPQLGVLPCLVWGLNKTIVVECQDNKKSQLNNLSSHLKELEEEKP